MLRTMFATIIIVGTTLNINGLSMFDNYSYETFVESNEALVNPYMGYAPWAINMTEDSIMEQRVSLAFALLYWSDFEPNKGFYDFETFEKVNNLDILRENNIKLIIRIVCDYPTTEKHIDIPTWLYDEMGGTGSYYNNNGLLGFVPDYSDSYFIERHGLMLKAFGERYDNSPDVAFIQLGSLGHWGEWHNAIASDSPFPTEDITDAYVEQYLTAFANKKLQMRRPFQITNHNRIGLYNDMTGHLEATQTWLGWINDYNMMDIYKYSPVGGEFASTYTMNDYFSNMYTKVKRMITDSHMTFIGNMPPDTAGIKENADDLLKTIGYRFVVRNVMFSSKVSQGDGVYIHICIENTGVAPFYYRWPLYYLFYDMEDNLISSYELEWDIREIIPNKLCKINSNIPIQLPKGDYTIKFGIINPDTNKADVSLANIDIMGDTLLTIGKISIR